MTIQNAARQDDGAIASSHLAAGFPIYYSEADTPPDAIIKEYPGGRRELVSFDLQGEHFVQAIACYRASGCSPARTVQANRRSWITSSPPLSRSSIRTKIGKASCRDRVCKYV